MDSIESVVNYSKNNYGFMCAFLHLKWNPSDWDHFVHYAVEHGEYGALEYYLVNHPGITSHVSGAIAETGESWALKLVAERFGRVPHYASTQAARNGRLECLQFLLSVNYAGPSTTHAIINENYRPFKGKFQMPSTTFAEKRAVINYGNRHNAAMAAAANGHLKCLKFCGIFEVELAVVAARRGHTDIFRYVIRKLQKTQPEQWSRELDQAISKYPSLIGMLYQATGRFPQNAAYAACTRNDTDALLDIIEAGERIDFRVFHHAATVGASECLELLLKLRPGEQPKPKFPKM
ncbi:MAG: hypothetical protein MUO31_07700 [Thermodesulfovibrionales bacterium]|nr:hypothetical protein [Thermodesulfovibrionales bacterium]